LGEESVTAGGFTLLPVFAHTPFYITAVGQPFDGHAIFYSWTKGLLSWKRSPGEAFHLPSNPFLLAKLRQKH